MLSWPNAFLVCTFISIDLSKHKSKYPLLRESLQGGSQRRPGGSWTKRAFRAPEYYWKPFKGRAAGAATKSVGPLSPEHAQSATYSGPDCCRRPLPGTSKALRQLLCRHSPRPCDNTFCLWPEWLHGAAPPPFRFAWHRRALRQGKGNAETKSTCPDKRKSLRSSSSTMQA